ncbi:hypothetical protein L227DRAFT_656770 [Lentinus tigrinus ALCF2SS1-6]|uniref:Uncharacterized protein n=2 Tax=Lentinus tigrinus TaxID=5365 RepID=A0A5C2RVA6_9APHY|nr:hypothetical protein L227DRAFT_656770 [Lentinus tigrinus ALCF2SS1-6]
MARDPHSPPLACSLCDTVVHGDAAWAVHIANPAHEAAARKAADQPSWPVDLSKDKSYRCTFCKVSLTCACLAQHIRGAAHIVRQRAALGLAEIAREERAYGVEVLHLETGVDFGQLSIEEGAKGKTVKVVVKNVSAETLHIVRTKVAAPFRASISGNGRDIAPGAAVTVRIKFVHGETGVYDDRVEITLQRGSQDPMTVSRKLVAVVKGPMLGPLLPAPVVQAQGLPPNQAVLTEKMQLQWLIDCVPRLNSDSYTSSSASSDEESYTEGSVESLDESTSVCTQCKSASAVVYHSVGVQAC